jgi:hypothetical protein
MSECFTQPDFTEMAVFPEMSSLTHFEFRGNGLISVIGISKKMPALEVLDLSENKIFEVETVDELGQLENLMVVNIESNPIMLHKEVKDMLLEQVKYLEVFNDRALKDVGSSYVKRNEELKRNLLEMAGPPTGTVKGDQLLAEAHADPLFEIN